MLTRLAWFGPALSRTLFNSSYRLASHMKTSEVAGSIVMTEAHLEAKQGGHGEVSQYFKNPDYHGFSSDPLVDEWNMRVGFFFGISVALVIGGTFIHYLPDHGMRQWARREAEHLVQQREKDNLPLIEENYYDPSKIVMPTADEA